MKKLAKIVAALLVGVVVVGASATPAKAGVDTSSVGDTLKVLNYLAKYSGATQNSQLSAQIADAYTSLYQVYYITYQAEQYQKNLKDMYMAAKYFQPYAEISNGSNPYTQYYNQMYKEYQVFLNKYYN